MTYNTIFERKNALIASNFVDIGNKSFKESVMSKKLNIVGFAGSLRKASWNAGLLREAQSIAPAEMEIEIIELADIPLYNGDVEAVGYPGAIAYLREKVRAADGVIIVTPEYNGSYSAVTKNAYDWLSRPENCLPTKPLLIMSVSAGGSGGSRALGHLEPIAKGGGMRLVEPSVMIPFGSQKFDFEGGLTDFSIRDEIIRGLNDLIKTIAMGPAR